MNIRSHSREVMEHQEDNITLLSFSVIVIHIVLRTDWYMTLIIIIIILLCEDML